MMKTEAAVRNLEASVVQNQGINCKLQGRLRVSVLPRELGSASHCSQSAATKHQNDKTPIREDARLKFQRKFHEDRVL
jgi:hypothetical protein